MEGTVFRPQQRPEFPRTEFLSRFHSRFSHWHGELGLGTRLLGRVSPPALLGAPVGQCHGCTNAYFTASLWGSCFW